MEIIQEQLHVPPPQTAPGEEAARDTALPPTQPRLPPWQGNQGHSIVLSISAARLGAAPRGLSVPNGGCTEQAGKGSGGDGGWGRGQAKALAKRFLITNLSLVCIKRELTAQVKHRTEVSLLLPGELRSRSQTQARHSHGHSRCIKAWFQQEATEIRNRICVQAHPRACGPWAEPSTLMAPPGAVQPRHFAF